MELLEFARGPALTFALTVFIAGVVFRIAVLLFMWRTKDSSAGSAREKSGVIAALQEIGRRMWPLSPYRQRTLFNLINGYVFHIGLAIIVFLLLPHILFFKDLTGLYWGHLPNNVIYAISIVTLISLIAALVMVGFAGYEAMARQEQRLAGGWGFGIGALAMGFAGISVTVLALGAVFQPDPWF